MRTNHDFPLACFIGVGFAAARFCSGENPAAVCFAADAQTIVGQFGIPQKDAFNFLVGAQGFVGAEYFVFPKVGLGAQYTYAVAIGYQKSKDANTGVESSKFGFNIGNTNTGLGTASVLLNLYF